MVNWSDAEHRRQVHRMTTDRINRQGWRWSGDRVASEANVRRGFRVAANLRGVAALSRAAGRLLVAPVHRGTQPS